MLHKLCLKVCPSDNLIIKILNRLINSGFNIIDMNVYGKYNLKTDGREIMIFIEPEITSYLHSDFEFEETVKIYNMILDEINLFFEEGE